jgi:hypothetical protein
MCPSFRLVFALAALLMVTSCSSDTIKRNAYHSVQTMQQRECLKTPGVNCPEPESYNKYEKKREEELKK